MQEAFGIVIFAVVGISVVLAVVSLFFRGRTYDQIGRGGIGDDREIRPAANRSHPPGAVDLGERDDEIRQMLAARNARHAARGEEALDIEAELARLTAPAVDPALREEIRELVIARNSRREAKGQPPLDVDAEVERQIRDLGG
jgi:hypothetical protein